MPNKDKIIQEIKDLEKEFNDRLKKLSDQLPKKIKVHVAAIPHPKFEGDLEKDFVTVWAHNKEDSTRAF